jgi:carbon monoxide dehydrogenase subunit G
VRIERSETVRRPLAEVYALLSDPGRVAEWREDVQSSERLSPPGDLDGARYRETIATPFGSQTATVRLSVDAPLRFGFEVLDGPLRPTGTIVLAERGAETDIRYTIELQPLLKVRTPIDDAAEKFLTRSIERSLARVKALLEA